jgi:hypothetical protein
MAREDIKKLGSRDPAVRIQGIKAVAKAKDRNALKKLAKMSGDDPEPKVRKLAKQAGIYIRQQYGEVEAGEGSKKPRKLYVDPKDAESAQRYMSSAMTANMNGDKARVMKDLTRAGQLDPNLPNDPFFVSLAEQATGLHGDEAVAAVSDESQIQVTEEKEAKARESHLIEEHLAKISKASWPDVGFDFAIVTIICVVGAVLALFLATQQAQAYWDGYQEDIITYNALNRVHRDADNDVVYPKDCANPTMVVREASTPTEQPVLMNDPTCSFNDGTDYWAVNEYWRELGVGSVLVYGLLAGLGIPLLIALMIGTAHVVASNALGGEGRLEYYAHTIASLMMNRTVLLAALCLIGAFMFFSSGSSGQLFLGLIGAFVGFVALTVIMKTGPAYRINPVMGGIAALVGIGVAAGLGGGVAFVFLI